MKTTLTLGSSPVEENCIQVGSENYREKAMYKCRLWMAQLRKKFPNVPGRFKIESFPHDFGTYHEVVYEFIDDDKNWKIANKIDTEMDTHWNDENTALMAYVKVCESIDEKQIDRIKERIAEAVSLLEDEGYAVISPEEVIIQPEADLRPDLTVKTGLSLNDFAKINGYDDIIDIAEDYFNEDVVPALCIHGCLVEPDGTCQHGHESVLLAIGVI